MNGNAPLPNLILPECDYSCLQQDDQGRYWHFEAIGRLQPQAADVMQPLLRLGLRQAVIFKRENYTVRDIVEYKHSFLLPLDGQLILELDGKRYTPSVGQLVYYPPETPLSRSCPGKVCYLHLAFLDSPTWQPVKKRGIYVRQYESADLLYLLVRRIADAYGETGGIGLQSARNDAAFLAELLKLEITRAGTRPHKRHAALRKLVAEIRERPELDRSLKEMAQQLHVSIFTLNRMFTKEYGITPVEMVIRERMMKARNLLATTEDTIQSVAAGMGYKSVTSFSRLFKKHIGKPPGECRGEEPVLLD